jgi:hypothetical protein
MRLHDGADFAGELSDGIYHSDWPFLWTGLDWLLKKQITRAPNDDPSIDTSKPTFLTMLELQTHGFLYLEIFIV